MGERPADQSTDWKWIPVLRDGLPQSIQDKASKDLNETEEKVRNGIVKLRAFIKEHNYPNLEDDCLLSFLRVSKFKTEKALDRLQKYYLMRIKMAAFFLEWLDPDKIRAVIEHKMIGVLPYRDEAGRTIIYSQGVAWNPEIWEFESFVVTFFILLFFFSTFPVTSVSGFRYIVDLKPNHFNDYYVYYKNLKSYHSMLTAVPFRFQRINVVHDNSVCRWLYNLLRPLLPTKLTKRIQMHGYDFDSLHQAIDPKILPEEFGGTLGPLNNDFFMEKFLEYVLKFKAQNELYKT